METMNIKIKEDGKKWKKIPISMRVKVRDVAEAYRIACAIADFTGKEVRWSIDEFTIFSLSPLEDGFSR